MSAPRPSVFDTCLRGLSRKSPQEMHRTQETLRTVMHTIYSMLHTVAMNFLKSQVRGWPRAICCCKSILMHTPVPRIS